MNHPVNAQKTTPLESFCIHVSQKFGLLGFRDAEVLSTEFRHFFHLGGAPRLDDLIRLAPKIGVSTIGPFPSVSGERGFFVKLDQDVEVHYKHDDWSGSQEHTIGHEIREIIGTVAGELFPDFVDFEGEDLENEADAFAAALSMEKGSFYGDMVSCGYDPIYLHGKYHKSYIGVVSRMATVLDMCLPKVQFWGSVFESDQDAPPGYFRAKCFHRSPRYLPFVRYKVPNFLFPKRGQLVPLKGGLLKAFGLKRPVLIRRIIGLDFWDLFTLSAIVRPVLWGGEVAKLIVIALQENEAYRFREQILSVSPTVMDESFQSL